MKNELVLVTIVSNFYAFMLLQATAIFVLIVE